jgi:hypothetical protein
MELKPLPWFKRLLHPKIGKGLCKLALSIFGMYVGTLIAHEGRHIHLAFDTLGLSIHGIMLYPIARYSEALWLVFGE